ncbi:MAG: hypothetical protein AAGJ46_12540 [Planctomycetota bacterium]
MRGGYTSFDTLSLEWGDTTPDASPAPLAPLPVLARVPAVDAKPDGPALSAPRVTAIPAGTQASPSVIEVHAIEALSPPALGAAAPPPPSAPPRPQTPPPPVLPEPARPGEDRPLPELPETDTEHQPLATHREFRVDPSPSQPGKTSAGRPNDNDGWITALLRAEAAVAPYSQIIVLLTLLAAAGLTVLLLRGDASRFDTGTPAPATTRPVEPSYAQLTPATTPHPSPRSEPVAAADGQHIAVRGPVGVRRAPAAAPSLEPQPPASPRMARLSGIQPAEGRTK